MMSKSSIITNPAKPDKNLGKHFFMKNQKKLFQGSKGETVMVKNGLPAIHPGEFLTEILGEMRISQAEFARAIGVSPMRISHIIKGDRPVTAELALLFGRAFNQSPQYWLNLQAYYDLKIAKASIGKRLAGIHAFAHA